MGCRSVLLNDYGEHGEKQYINKWYMLGKKYSESHGKFD